MSPSSEIEPPVSPKNNLDSLASLISGSVLIIAFALAVFYYFENQYRRDFSFVLSNHLQSVKGRVIRDGNVEIIGRWNSKDSRIEYPSLPNWLSISRQVATFSGVRDARIFLHPFPRATHELRWENIPTGSHLRLMYGFSDEALSRSSSLSVDFEVQTVGGAMLFSTRVSCDGTTPCQTGLKTVDILDPFRKSRIDADTRQTLILAVRPIGADVSFNWFFVDGYVW